MTQNQNMEQYSTAGNVARDYYNSDDADRFYFHLWGGEDIHIGIYDSPGIDVAKASRLTVEMMLQRLSGLASDSQLIDIGSGYGGAARYLAHNKGCHVTCVNISDVENSRNREMNHAASLDRLIDVKDGSFENIPCKDASFDYAWSQDAILHSGDKERVLREVHRVLKPGGEFIFTDPMQREGVSPSEIQPVLNRIHLDSMGSFPLYIELGKEIGLELVEKVDLTEQLTRHYQRIYDEIHLRENEIKGLISSDYLERMKAGLLHWVDAGKSERLSWGILHMKKRK